MFEIVLVRKRRCVVARSFSMCLSGLVLIVVISSMAWSQQTQPNTSSYTPGGYTPGTTFYQQPYYGGGWGGYGFGYGFGAGTTAAGSYMSGMASAIRAQGQYNALSAEAAVNLEEAKKREIENRVRWSNAYYEMRKMNKAYLDSQKAPKLSTEEWARLAHETATPRLGSHSLDVVNGEITWPAPLRGAEFKPERDRVQALFAQRAESHGAIGVEQHSQIRKAVNTLMAKLKDHIREFDTRAYLEARNFLSSLAREADFPAG
jgi:hypothetical protein